MSSGSRCLHRPPHATAATAALVVSAGGIGEGARLLWVAMITSADNRPWPGDVPFGAGYASAGLPAPSIVRPCKLATIEAADADRLGRIAAPKRSAVTDAVASHLGRPWSGRPGPYPICADVRHRSLTLDGVIPALSRDESLGGTDESQSQRPQGPAP